MYESSSFAAFDSGVRVPAGGTWSPEEAAAAVGGLEFDAGGLGARAACESGFGAPAPAFLDLFLLFAIVGAADLEALRRLRGGIYPPPRAGSFFSCDVGEECRANQARPEWRG